MNFTLLSRPAAYVVVAAVVVAVFFGVRSVMREPQQLCFRASVPGTVLTVRGMTVTSTYVPVAFTLPEGRSAVTIETTDGTRAEGTITVASAERMTLTLDNEIVRDLTRVDFCDALSTFDTYAVEVGGVITVYRTTTGGIAPTGFTLTRAERDGITAPANAIVSPNGVYVAYITWDPTLNATTLSVAEVSGKNATVLASLTPEQGEMALNELSWSSSASVAYAEIVPMVDAPDADGNAHEKTLYRIEVLSRIRTGVHIVAVP